MNQTLEQDFTGRTVTLSTGAVGLRVQLPVKATPIADQADVLDMTASNETLDRYHEIIKADGWQLDNYRKNPVVQNSHQYGDVLFTLGKALSTAVKDGALVQRWQFASDLNPVAKIASGMYRGGFLNASSVGFIPLEWQNGMGKDQPSRTYLKQELLEVSAVGIPANPDALALAVKSGAIATSDLRELYALLKHFCNDPADPIPNARASGLGVYDAQWLQLARATQNVLRRA